MTKQEIISRIIELEKPITTRTIEDLNFRPNDSDEYQSSREELKRLREEVKDDIYPKSYLPNGKKLQIPDYDELENWKKIMSEKESK
jgi:hypothetical protein